MRIFLSESTFSLPKMASMRVLCHCFTNMFACCALDECSRALGTTKDAGCFYLIGKKKKDGDVAQFPERRLRRAADAHLTLVCGKGLFSQSQLSVQTLVVFVQFPCAVACLNIMNAR